MSPAVLRNLQLVALLVLLPLAMCVIGLWELQRVRLETQGADSPAVVAEVAELREMQRRVLTDGSIQVKSHGKLYSYGAAHAVLQERIDRLNGGGGRHWGSNTLAPKAIAGFSALAVGSGGIGLLLGLGGLVMAILAGRMARRSRERLIAIFSLSREILPFLLAGVVLLMVLGLAGLTGVEGWRAFDAMVHNRLSRSETKLYVGLILLCLLAIWGGLAAIYNLRKAFAAFHSEPIEQFGRAVTAAQAPGLWRHVQHLAGKLQAPVPDHIVVGLTDGFYVTAHPMLLLPEQRPLSGETLYLPLSYAALIRPDEFNAIVGHELGHFSGDDTAYTRRFVPMHAGMQRSLELAAEGGWMVAPARLLGEFLMEQVNHAVMHWSREREFVADGAGKHIAGSRASARALVRSSAVGPVIRDFLGEVFRRPEDAPADLLQALVDHARTHGLAQPELEAESATAHPTDTHPPTVQRIKALGEHLDAGLLAEAGQPVDERGMQLLDTFFVDRLALQRQLSADLASASREHQESARAELQSLAAEAEADPAADVMEKTWRMIALFGFFAVAALAFGGWAVVASHKASLQLLGLGALALALLFVWAGWLFVQRGRRPVMHLAPSGLSGGGLAAEVPWSAIDDLKMTVVNDSSCTIVFVLDAHAEVPRLLHGNLRRMAYKAKKRHLIINMTLPKGISYDLLSEKIARYRRAAYARDALKNF